MKYIKYIVITVTILLLSGCSIKNNSVSELAAEHEPVKSNVAYEVLGETSGSAETTRFLIFGPYYTDGDMTTYQSHFEGEMEFDLAKTRAIFNAIDSVPNAHALINPRWKIEEEIGFLWLSKTTKATVYATAIKYITKEEKK